jgi:nicotinamide-nucleotide amidase
MIPDFDALADEAAALLALCRAAGVKLATAESCTGGLAAAALTEVPGSSDVFERGFVTYSNAAKTDLLGVPAGLIEAHGAVSEPVARAMAQRTLDASNADLSVAVTGIAGPGGGSSEKPVGLVHIAAARRGGRIEHRALRLGDIGRRQVRAASVLEAFRLLRILLGEGDGQARASALRP